MEDSPLISPIIKEYCAKFDIENIMNSAINEVMLKMPSDPYSFFCNIHIRSTCLSVFGRALPHTSTGVLPLDQSDRRYCC